MSLVSPHQTVMLQEAVEALEVKPSGTYVDGTFGYGGHSRAILERLGPNGRLLALDRDPQAVAAAAAINDQRLTMVHQSFGELAVVVRQAGIDAVDGVLLDIGVSSPQLDDGERGFSFRFDAPLDMRMDTDAGRDGGCVSGACRNTRKSRRSLETMAKNGLLSRLQRRLWLLGASGLLQPRASSPRLYARPCGPASPARIRRRVPFRLYGFMSIKSSSNWR